MSVDATRWLLALALSEVAYGVVGGVVLGGGVAVDPTRWWVASSARGVLAGASFAGFAGLLALVAVIAAVGTAARQPWGRGLAWVVGGGTLLTGCAPVGLLLWWSLWESAPPAPGEAT
ncbi:MAG: hypothetical protein H6738_13725 [Alphaproteobacteria bacterium]|nr:hypothetical protein [Alphaproteobacteria bacterium]